MNWSPVSLATRRREPEWMDQPGLDRQLHEEALRGLRRVNRVSRTADIVWNRVRPLLQRSPGGLRLLDIACGGGDTAIALKQRSQRAGLTLEVAACDISSTALAVAEQAAEAAQQKVHFFQADVLNRPLPTGFDVICCSLFLHHLEEEEAVAVLRSMHTAAKKMLLVSDLNRTTTGYLMAWWGIRLLTRSTVCHVDGPLSVQGAFTPGEAAALARRAGIERFEISRHWPQRFLLAWSRP